MTLSIQIPLKLVEVTHVSVASIEFLKIIHCSPEIEIMMGIFAVISFCHFLCESGQWLWRKHTEESTAPDE
ncbi:hypothetical protein [Novosphingobium beihaiensis]|uniref:Uncharacterized protein n=1 Tax=Novosphingobium beihaiensis TaxID=2930389 RepID=A0ABT0BVS7_9SPHN|nr:hypothetical protein [Novosphingobium beihaiensis]MCJ2189163.1 hypothetical protein [Novosphingobium beihaiensis]